MFCPRCGQVVAKGARFCSSCGAPIESKLEVSAENEVTETINITSQPSTSVQDNSTITPKKTKSPVKIMLYLASQLQIMFAGRAVG